MYSEFFVEDESTAAAIEIILERLYGSGGSFAGARVRPLRGKQRMLKTLPGIFQSRVQMRHVDRLIVVIDGDNDDCHKLKAQIYTQAVEAGLIRLDQPTYLSRLRIRIAMTELESWFIGDPRAVQAAYPRLTVRDMRLRAAEEVDSLNQAWEWLERRLIQRGYYATRMPKVEVACAISAHLNLSPDANASPSFRLFLRTLCELYELPT